MPVQLSPIRTGRHRSPLTTDHDRRSFNYLPASSPAAPAATPTLSVPRLDADDEHVSVHDLLDLTWHYQCVVSPSFSAAALAGALSGQLTSRIRSPSSSSASAGATYTNQNLLKELKLKIKDDCRVTQFDLLRVRHESGQAGGPPSLQSAEAVLGRLQPEAAIGENYGHLTSHSHGKTEEDGYVSLASLLMGSPEASMDIASPTSESPHHNYIELALDLFNFRKQSIKTRSRTSTFTSRTCRDNERMSARHHSGADSSRIGSYARYLAVD